MHDHCLGQVDAKTDALIQATVRECFGGSTVLIIAHRLSTLRHVDRIIAMDDGSVRRDGKPAEFLSDLGDEAKARSG